MNTYEIEMSPAELAKWFTKQGFEKVEFKKAHEYVSSYWLDQSVSVKLTRRDGFDTWYKVAYGGSFLVFEVALQGHTLSYDCFCPIWLFGIWSRKVSFKKDAGGIVKYRKEGYEFEEKFKRFLDKKGA